MTTPIRITPVDPATATGKAKDLLGAVRAKLGVVPNLTRVLANSPAALQGYLGLSSALGGGALSPKQREQVALAVGEANRCGYCVSAHTFLGDKLGLSADDLLDARRGTASDPKTAALLQLAANVVERRGELEDEHIAKARAAGITEQELVEIVALVALNVFTNYLNHVAGTEIDFPLVSLESANAAS
jgi:uncharacterized peroxidase-related enzyme